MLLASPTLSWLNVGLGFLFIVFDAVLSASLGLGIGGSLLVAATRCVIQLSVMGLVLDKVFASQNIWGVVGIAGELAELCGDKPAGKLSLVLLNLLGAFETTYNKTKKRFSNMVSTTRDASSSALISSFH